MEFQVENFKLIIANETIPITNKSVKWNYLKEI
jgi:hypothetical protein